MLDLALRHRLRVETADVHERLHQHRLFAAIADGNIGSDDFDRLMARMGGFYAALDPLMIVAGRKAQPGTYTYRARTPMFSRVDGHAPILQRISDLASLAGAAYVVDGSVLGGQILRRAIAGRLTHPYWDWCATDGPSVWRETQKLIELVDTDACSANLAIKVANDVFNAFSVHMNLSCEETAA